MKDLIITHHLLINIHLYVRRFSLLSCLKWLALFPPHKHFLGRLFVHVLDWSVKQPQAAPTCVQHSFAQETNKSSISPLNYKKKPNITKRKNCISNKHIMCWSIISPILLFFRWKHKQKCAAQFFILSCLVHLLVEKEMITFSNEFSYDCFA